ncbi:unnamed protein product [Cylicocyclus nassatus]|uniref:Uncharacterized protein n=1 Tax=Cylicocyclus nassatus TaxID=53992 RepID=A0AA36H5N5_CYLNA|nr:unnamed protein product [Cylicocyclus nassatus]
MLVRAVVGTLAGCVGCQAGVEILQRKVKNSLNLLTLATCVFVSLEGILFRSMLSVKQEIPLRVYIKIVSIFFIVNLCNNTSIRCDIYFPLFIIFKSGSLLANIILCTLLRNRIYTTTKIFSVLIVTAGIIMFTLASYESKPSISTSDLYFFGIPPFCVGLVLLTTALMLSAYLGICQEDMYRTYGKHAKQSMFMVHTLSIPVYIVLGSELYDAVLAANSTEPFQIFDCNLLMPAAWVYILTICVLQYICIDNVYRLTALTTSLNVTMVTSIRKFISVLISFMAIANSKKFKV